MSKEITIIIATESKDKIEGIKNAFLQYFPSEEYTIKIYYGKTESEVDEQPFGNDTYTGAYNRINNIKKRFDGNTVNDEKITADYYVSCEAGIDDTNKVIIKGVPETIYASEQIACVYIPKDDSYTFGKSCSWIIPSEDIEEIRKTNLDSYLRKKECTGLQDIGEGKYITRSEAVVQAVSSALASKKLKEKSKEKSEKELDSEDAAHKL